ncbi:MAG: DUF47 domain-containing protein [Armatimonadota bacterium]
MAKLRLLPRDEKFFELFEKAAGVVLAGAETLHTMLCDFDNADTYRKQIGDLEHEGDAVIHAVMDKLNRTFVTPFDQEDIRAIASRLDDIIDYTQAAAERLVLYQVKEPYPDSVELAGVLVKTVRQVQLVVGMLRDLGQRRAILEACIEINRLENAGDKLYREALGRLFCEGNVIELMRWKEIFEQIEQAIDQCEDLADVIESVVVKHA